MNKTFKLGQVVIDFENHCLISNEQEIHLDHKACEVLKLLINSPNKTVTTDIFMNEVWADKPSSPEVVTSSIARLRKALKQSGITSEVIQTVHKVGYKFISLNDSGETRTALTSKKALGLYLFFILVLSVLLSWNFGVFTQNKTHREVLNNNDKHQPLKHGGTETLIHIIRHAEKNSIEDEDPPLSPTGIKRAKYWKNVFQHTQFDRIYTTDFIRNIQTADILASGTGLTPEFYFPVSFEVAPFLEKIKGQSVLIIGHSNTIPDMVNRITGRNTIPPMSHRNYNLLHTITISNNGESSVSILHIELPRSMP